MKQNKKPKSKSAPKETVAKTAPEVASKPEAEQAEAAQQQPEVNEFDGHKWHNEPEEITDILESALAACGKCSKKGREDIAKALQIPECTVEAITNIFTERCKALYFPAPETWELLAIRDPLTAAAKVLAREREAREVLRAMSSANQELRKQHTPWFVKAGDIIFTARKVAKAQTQPAKLKSLAELFE